MRLRKLFFSLLLLVGFITSCQYDDSALWDELKNLGNRVTTLEEQLVQINSDIQGLQTVVTQLQNKVFVNEVVNLENGVKIIFSDGTEATINNGRDGQNGTDGQNGMDAPIIGIGEFEGKYYWNKTYNGQTEWLLDSNNEKIPVSGKDAITPLLKVSQDGHWLVSYDNGASYSEILDDNGNPIVAVGKDGADGQDGVDGQPGANGQDGTDGQDGDSFFQNVYVDGNELVLVLLNGTEWRIPIVDFGTTTVSGTVNNDNVISVDNIINSTTSLEDGFNLSTPISDIPHLLSARNQNDDVVMLVRNDFTSSENIEFNAENTAIALITMHPVFALIKNDDYPTVINNIKALSGFSSFVSKVQESIDANRDIFDTANNDLLLAYSSLMEEFLSSGATSVVMSRANISNWEQLNINNPYPFLIEVNDNVMSIVNTALSPAYKGTVVHPLIGEMEYNIPSRAGYGGWELIEQALHGWSSGEWGNLGNGDPANFTFTDDGEYNFNFKRNELDFYIRLITDILREIGLPIPEDANVESVFGTTLDEMMGDIAAIQYTPNEDDPLDYVVGIGEVVVNTLTSDDFKNSINGINFYSKYTNAEKFLAMGKRALIWYNVIKGSTNAILRISWRLDAPEFVKFCLCFYNNDVNSCSELTLVKYSDSDNQQGFPNQRLMLPVRLNVQSVAEDGTLIPVSEYQKVKFTVVSGGGSVPEAIVGTDSNGDVETYWNLGADGEQKLQAVAIDMITGEELSEPVFFTASLKEEADITVRLDWNKLSGNTDIDLHVVDPFGEEIYYAHMSSASGGWLDRDDIVGPGPEHIYWQSAPSGTYTVIVHYYGSETREITNYKVTMNICGETYGPFVGSISYHDYVTIGTFTIPSSSNDNNTVTRSGFANKPFFTEDYHIEKNKVFEDKNYD